jgi:hypothetical protein
MKRRITEQLYRLRDELGGMGVAALALFVAAGAFMTLVLQPLKEHNRVLAAKADIIENRAAPAVNSGEKLAAVYDYLRKPEQTTDWLAKLYAIGHSTGVELAQASYKSQLAPGGKLERYEIVLPLTGSYAQMREFLKRSLADIPVLSLDQISLKRENRRDGTVQAELRLTLHMVKP